MRGKEVKLIFLAVSLATLMISASFAEDVKTSVDITSVGMGARPIALGGAYTGIADDASAIFTNPAGLGRQKTLSFVSMSTQLLTCVDYKLIGFSYPTQYGNFGIGYVGASTAAGDHTYYSGGVTIEGGAMNYTNQMLILSCGYDISDRVSGLIRSNGGQVQYFGLGANIKFLSQGLSGSIKNAPSAGGMVMDLGAIYVPTDRLTLGATLQNIIGTLDWSTGEKEKLPKVLKIGGAYKAANDVTVSIDTDLDLDGVTNTVAHGGVEWQVIPLLALRAGMDQKVESIDDETMGTTIDYSLGVGVMVDGFRFDYAYRQDPNFADLSTHYFSISYSGPAEEKPAKKITEPENVTSAPTDKPKYEKTGVSEGNPLPQYEKLIQEEYKTPYQKLVEKSEKISQAK